MRVWPFFYYRQEKDGSEYLYWPCLIPVDYEGFEKNWVPLLSLYEYRRNSPGRRANRNSSGESTCTGRMLPASFTN